jgi:dTDP-4-amino-4,6-dideoxygalactose transaminase
MTEIQAAIGLVQLRKLDSFIKMQVENAKELFKILPKEVHPPFIPDYAEPTLYIVGCTVEEGFPREKFVEALTRKGVNRLLPGATVSLGYTKTIMELPLLKKFKKPCPVAEDLVKKFLWFDITRWKTKDELQKELDIIKEVLTLID